MQEKNAHKRDALYAAWSEDRAGASPKSLKAWLSECPDEEADLIAWTAAAPVMERAETYPADLTGEARAAEIGHRVVAEMRARYETALTSLLAMASSNGLTEETLAERLDLSEPILIKLERRLLRFASIPGEVVNRIAEVLQVSARQVQSYLSQPPTLAANAMYRADSVPKARQQDFAEAVESCFEMSEVQKRFWLNQEQTPE
jgi:transcriptional regulator with XRE-family HTH domain